MSGHVTSLDKIEFWLECESVQASSFTPPLSGAHAYASIQPFDSSESAPRAIDSQDGPNVTLSRSSAVSSELDRAEKVDSAWNASAKTDAEENLEARIERLGRQRPSHFTTVWAEAGFVFSIVMSQLLTEYFVSGFTVALPTITDDLGIPGLSRTWPQSAFSLTIASTLLVFGRFSDMYGGYPLYVGGMAWLMMWSLIAGFSTSPLTLDICRALQGLGAAAFLPSGIMLLGSIYRPGLRKNLIFSLYGACAPGGQFFGSFFAGLAGQYASWRWYFWIGCMLAFITAITSFLNIPSDVQGRNGLDIKMDWYGACLSIVGLILFTFAIIDSSHAPDQWQTPYIYVLFVAGVFFLAAAAYVECFTASNPLLPASLFKVPCMSALISALFFSFGSLGIFLLYTTFYMEQIMGASPLLVVAWFTPMALGGCVISTFGGFFLHLLPGTVLILIAGISWIIAPLLFAIAPERASYWVYVFPSMICATIGIDVTFNVANIFITTSLPKRQQGLAGAVVMLILHLGIAIFLGFADIINTCTLSKLGLKSSYQAVFWFEVACASAALIILAIFVKIGKAKSALSADDIVEFLTEERKTGEQSKREGP